jgi:sRNA-binding regulator protein Hfq
MKYLSGLQEYLDVNYDTSIFDQALASKEHWEVHLYGHRIIKAIVLENLKYDVKIQIKGGGDKLLAKTDIKIIYPENMSESVRPLLKEDEKIRALSLEPIIPPQKRHHIKNKSLFPLMKDRRLLFFTLLEGEIVRGIVAGFSRYEITVNLKGGVPVTILRHAVYDLRDKRNRCFLKAFQEKHRDWEKSPLFVSSPPDPNEK